MKRALSIVTGLALVLACGCDKDSDNDSAPASETNAPGGSRNEPQYCIPANYSVPSGSTDSTNRVRTITQTVGTPDDPYYRVTVTTDTFDGTRYGDGTIYALTSTTVRDTIVDAGVTNSTFTKDEQTVITLFDNTKLSSDLTEHETNDVQDQYQYSAFLECNDGTVNPVTQDVFDDLKSGIGL